MAMEEKDFEKEDYSASELIFAKIIKVLVIVVLVCYIAFWVIVNFFANPFFKKYYNYYKTCFEFIKNIKF